MSRTNLFLQRITLNNFDWESNRRNELECLVSFLCCDEQHVSFFSHMLLVTFMVDPVMNLGNVFKG